tara:strand:+ start:138 stop:530 length:393 start_codon:yes stop_codon:yes gene_type:complete
MNPTTPEQFNFVIQSTIETTFKTICSLHDLNEVTFDWVTNIASTNGTGASLVINWDMQRSRVGRHLLERFRNAVNAFGYDFEVKSACKTMNTCALFISLSEEIRQDMQDAEYGEFCDREEELLRESGRLY